MTKEEAIKIVRENMHLSNDEGNIVEALKTLVPELRESEDERIRKWLIEMVEEVRKANPTNAEHNEKCSEAIAYLEKLKDLTKEGIIKQLEEEFYACGTTPKWFHDTVQGAINHGRADALSKFNAVPSVVSDELRRQERETAISQLKHLNDVYIGDEKQKEQEPSQYDIDILEKHITKDSISELAHTVIIRNGWEIVEQEQKPSEWSEEDLSFLQRISSVIQWAACCTEKYRIINTDGASELQTWLQDLPNRFALQKSAEWSEEDEAAFGDLMWCIEQARKSAKDENDMGDIWFAENWVKNRLKFLRPQHITYALDAPLGYDKDMNPIYPPINHWKPTERQIAALEWQIKNTYDGSWQRKESESLYNDLKKL